MMKKLPLTKFKLPACALALSSCFTTAQAALFYTEDFEAGGAANVGHDAVGWSLVREDGVSYSASDGGFASNAFLSDMTGSYRTHVGANGGSGQSWFVATTEVGAFNVQSAELTDFSIQHLETGLAGANEGYRIAFRIGGSWYVDDSVTVAPSGLATSIVDISSLSFNPWAGAPANDTSAFDEGTATIGGGTSLPAGAVDAFGILLQNTTVGGRQEFRYDQISLSANQIPEPSSSLLLGLAGLALIVRRRK